MIEGRQTVPDPFLQEQVGLSRNKRKTEPVGVVTFGADPNE